MFSEESDGFWCCGCGENKGEERGNSRDFIGGLWKEDSHEP